MVRFGGDMAAQGYEALTEREKQTLRLLLEGHDAKSLARHFGLSVHTINERLRDARRKLSVSSSREAARLVREIEGADPQSFGDASFGAVEGGETAQVGSEPGGPRQSRRRARAIGGCAMILFLTALFAATGPVALPEPAASTAVAETDAARAARDWLALVDRSDWAASYAGTGASFRASNTLQMWEDASKRARQPLGAVVRRTLIADHDTPSPPNGSRTVRFRTDFADRAGATETLSLVREGGNWKVAGIYIE